VGYLANLAAVDQKLLRVLHTNKRTNV